MTGVPSVEAQAGAVLRNAACVPADTVGDAITFHDEMDRFLIRVRCKVYRTTVSSVQTAQTTALVTASLP